MSDGFYVNLATTVFYFPGCQPRHGDGPLRSREKWPLHQAPVALQTSYHGECKRIWPLQQTVITIHISETVIRQQGIRRLAGIYNSSNTEVAPTSCSTGFSTGSSSMTWWFGWRKPCWRAGPCFPMITSSISGATFLWQLDCWLKCTSIIGRLELVSSCLFWSVALACFGIGDNWNSLLCHEQPTAVKHSHGRNLPLTSRHLLMQNSVGQVTHVRSSQHVSGLFNFLCKLHAIWRAAWQHWGYLLLLVFLWCPILLLPEAASCGPPPGGTLNLTGAIRLGWWNSGWRQAACITVHGSSRATACSGCGWENAAAEKCWGRVL